MFVWLANQCKEHDLAWDCGAGNGQASTELARYFKRVVATDASEAQISQATPHSAVEYCVSPSESSGLDKSCTDIVVVAQALHWFDLASFYAEVRRVLKPDGLLAVWSYGVLNVGGGDVFTMKMSPTIGHLSGDTSKRPTEILTFHFVAFLHQYLP
jgi:ubiquinone/menaquinone biosynthesis C-methylase UbiE